MEQMKQLKKVLITALLVAFAGAALADTVPGQLPDGPYPGPPGYTCWVKNGVVYCKRTAPQPQN